MKLQEVIEKKDFAKSHAIPHPFYTKPPLVYYPGLDQQFQRILIDPLIYLLYYSPISADKPQISGNNGM